MKCKTVLALSFLGSLWIVGCGGGSSPTPKAPTANAGGPYTGTVGTAVSFNSSGSSDPQGQTLTYAWNFGDNSTGTGVSPTHKYTATGAYTVSLTVTDTSNLTGTATSTATISAAPPVANAGGPYTGTVGTAITFSGSGSSDPQGQTLSYAWNFGDKTTGTGVSPSHTYAVPGTYTVSLTVTDPSNLSGTATGTATIAAVPPVASAGGPYSGMVGTAVTFNGSGSTDPQGEILTYAWNFGDNSTGTGVSPSHTYSTPGTYTVTLTVTDTSNLTGTATAKATVNAPVPTVTIAASPATIAAGQSSILTWSSTNATTCTASGSWSGSEGTSGSSTVSPALAGSYSYTLTCSGAGGSANASAVLTVNVAATSLSAGLPRGYLETGTVSLGSLDSSLSSLTGLVVSQQSGPSMQWQLGAGNLLYYLSPVEQYSDTSSVLLVTSADGSKSWRVTFRWSSRVSPSLTRISEAEGDGTVPAPDNVSLTATGLGANGAISSSSFTNLSFQLINAPPLDASHSLISLIGSDNSSQDISGWFSYSSATNTFTLTSAYLTQLISIIQSLTKATIVFSLPTANFGEGFGFEQVLTYQDGTLNVAVLDTNGNKASGLAGTKFILKGFNTGFGTMASLDANATFTVGGLPADTYTVKQVLLSTGLPLIGFPTITSSSSTVTLTLSQSAASAALSKGSNALNDKGYVSASSRTETGPRPNRRSVTSPPRKASSGPALQGIANPIYTASVIAGAADTLITVPIAYSVPKGTSQIDVNIVEQTDEFPVYTGEQSQWNDIWSFDIQFPSLPIAEFADSGKVNDTNASTGTLTFDECIDVSSAATNSAFPISGVISVENVADDLFPTSLTLNISLSCGGIEITDFEGSSTTPDGNLSIYPRWEAEENAPDGNVSGQYLSIPMDAVLPSSFGIPAKLTYSPASAVVTAVDLFQRTEGSADVPLGTDYLDQADTSTPGELDFAGLLLDATAVTPLSARVQLMAELMGTVNGQAVTSGLFPLTIDGQYSTFTPIYLTSELPSYSDANRFGTHDEEGGDSWSTNSMSQWLFGTNLRYNDVSAANVKQDSSDNSSVLGHSGHSDGQQVDVMYSDGAGGYTDLLGGAGDSAGLAALAARALTEVSSGASNHPNLDLLNTWISANRTLIQSYAAMGNVRRIYVGIGHVEAILLWGQFPNSSGTAIPGASVWSGRSAKILPQNHHLNHWHISTNNP